MNATQISRDELQTMSRYIKILHHIPGRLRVRVSQEIKDALPGFTLDDLGRIARSIGVTDAKVKKIIGSITITYDTHRIKPSVWTSFVEGKVDPLFALIESAAV